MCCEVVLLRRAEETAPRHAVILDASEITNKTREIDGASRQWFSLLEGREQERNPRIHTLTALNDATKRLRLLLVLLLEEAQDVYPPMYGGGPQG